MNDERKCKDCVFAVFQPGPEGSVLWKGRCTALLDKYKGKEIEEIKQKGGRLRGMPYIEPHYHCSTGKYKPRHPQQPRAVEEDKA